MQKKIDDPDSWHYTKFAKPHCYFPNLSERDHILNKTLDHKSTFPRQIHDGIAKNLNYPTHCKVYTVVLLLLSTLYS